MKIYTRTGDKGETGYIGGRTSKASAMIDLLGTLDELNANVGMAISLFSTIETAELKQLTVELTQTQNMLFKLGMIVANHSLKSVEMQTLSESVNMQVKLLENLIDGMNVPELKNFILPGGSLPAAQLHLARTVCRRAERAAVLYASETEGEYLLCIQAVQKYLNRLSDMLFTAARLTNVALDATEIIWKNIA